MHESLLEQVNNAYNLYTHAIYLNNVWVTVLLEMVCITYQYVVCNACHKCTNIIHESLLEQVYKCHYTMVIIYIHLQFT